MSQSFSFESMGTSFEVTMWDDISPATLEALHKELFLLADEFDKKYSRFIKTSMVWQMAGKIGEHKVDEDFMGMLKVYQKFYELSGKKFNPLIGFTISDMGYDDKYSLEPKSSIRPTPDFSSALHILDDHTIYLSDQVLIDFGGVGKGYFVDKMADILKEKGYKRFLVNGSGDVYYSGQGIPIKAGLEHPDDPKKVIGTLELTEGSLCASGSNKRNWGPYHHIIDPQKLSSPTDIVATWVKADSATTADALATCLFLCPPENFSFYKFEYAILNNEHKIKRSAGFTAELF